MGSRWSSSEDDPQEEQAGGASKSPLAPYFQLCREYPSMSRVQFERLLLEYRAGSISAADLLVYSNVGLVIFHAKRFVRQGVPIEDLIQEGCEAIRKKVIPKFDLSRNVEFSTYASWWIRQAMRRYIANQRTDRAMRLPVHLGDRIWRVKNAKMQFYQRTGRQPDDLELIAEVRSMIKHATRARLTAEKKRTPTADELEAACDQISDYRLTPEQLVTVRRSQETSVSLDAPVKNKQGEKSDTTYGSRIEADSTALSWAKEEYLAEDVGRAAELLQWFLARMGEKMQKVFRRRFGLDGYERETLEEIGRFLGLSRERIRQIEMKGLARIAKRLGLSAKDVRRAFQALGERQSPSDAEGLHMDLWGAEDLEASFAILCEHAADPKETKSYHILCPVQTLRVRSGFDRDTAERLMAAMVANGWLSWVVGQDAVLLNRIDLMERLQETQKTETVNDPAVRQQRHAAAIRKRAEAGDRSRKKRERIPSIHVPVIRRRQVITDPPSIQESTTDVLAFFMRHAVLVAGERVIRGPVILLRARLKMTEALAERALQGLLEERKIVPRDEWRSIVICAQQEVPAPEPSHIACVLPEAVSIGVEKTPETAPEPVREPIERFDDQPSFEPAPLETASPFSLEPNSEQGLPTDTPVEVPAPETVEPPARDVASQEASGEPEIPAIEEILLTTGKRLGYGKAIAILRAAKREARTCPLVDDRDEIFVNVLGVSWISEEGAVTAFGERPLGLDPSIVRQWFARHRVKLPSITVRDRAWRTRVVYALPAIFKILMR